MVRERSNAKIHAEGEIRNSGEGKSEGNYLIIDSAFGMFILARYQSGILQRIYVTTYNISAFTAKESLMAIHKEMRRRGRSYD